MAFNVFTMTFDVESEAYQAISDLKRDFANEDYVLSHVSLVKNTGGHMILNDSFDSGVESTNDTRWGGLIGSLVGILGGPIGVILGGASGALVGSAIDTGDVADTASILEKVSEAIPDGKTALLILAEEISSGAVEKKLSGYEYTVLTQDAAEVAAEVEEAAALQRQLEKETRQKLRAERKAERRQSIEEKQNEMREKFNAFKEKHLK